MAAPMIAMAAFTGVKTIAGLLGAKSQIKAISQQQAEIARVASLNAKSQAESLAKEGALVAREKGKETQARAGATRLSYLSAGLTMEGTPDAVANDIFNIGLEDIRQIGSNYATRSRNIVDEILGKATIQNMTLQSQAKSLRDEAIMSAANNIGSLMMGSNMFAGTPTTPGGGIPTPVPAPRG